MRRVVSRGGGVACVCARGFTDVSHSYLHKPHIAQTDTVDDTLRTRIEQQAWLHNEQWRGYSDTYLQPHMYYAYTYDNPAAGVTVEHTILNECLGYVYDLYGTLADELQTLHDDVLHPRFHARIARIRRERERIADVLDAHYARLHPTVKTIYDALLVRRYYTLGDWCTYVEQKRADVLSRLSPAYLREAVRARGLAQQYIAHLRQLAQHLADDPTAGLLRNNNNNNTSSSRNSVSEADGDAHDAAPYTEQEVAILRQKAVYFRKRRVYGISQLDCDMRPY